MKTVLVIVFVALGGINAARLRRSTGGKQIPIEEAKYFAGIIRNYSPVCGGALISLNHVLTAAHCVVDKSLQKYPYTKVISGMDKLHKGGTCHEIEDVIYAPGYTPENLRDDIAVIILSTSVQLSPKVAVIGLATAKPRYGEVATTIAFETSDQPANSPLELIETKMVRSKTCIAYGFPDTVDLSTKFCAFNEVGQKSHQNDAGGPLVHNFKLVGIASAPSSEGRLINYYTKVYKFVRFIKRAMKAKKLRV